MGGERKGLLEEIYDKAVNGSEYMAQAEYEINKELKPFLAAYKEKLSEQAYMDLEEIVVGGVVAAEKAAFIAGVRYGMRLSAEGRIIGGEGMR